MKIERLDKIFISIGKRWRKNELLSKLRNNRFNDCSWVCKEVLNWFTKLECMYVCTRKPRLAMLHLCLLAYFSRNVLKKLCE